MNLTWPHSRESTRAWPRQGAAVPAQVKATQHPPCRSLQMAAGQASPPLLGGKRSRVSSSSSSRASGSSSGSSSKWRSRPKQHQPWPPHWPVRPMGAAARGAAEGAGVREEAQPTSSGPAASLQHPSGGDRPPCAQAQLRQLNTDQTAADRQLVKKGTKVWGQNKGMQILLITQHSDGTFRSRAWGHSWGHPTAQQRLLEAVAAEDAHLRGEGAAELAAAPAPPPRIPKAPAPATQAFMQFLHDEANTARWNAGRVGEKAKVASAEWKSLSPTAKQVYKDKAIQEAQRRAAGAGSTQSTGGGRAGTGAEAAASEVTSPRRPPAHHTRQTAQAPGMQPAAAPPPPAPLPAAQAPGMQPAAAPPPAAPLPTAQLPAAALAPVQPLQAPTLARTVPSVPQLATADELAVHTILGE
ncbi:hypothetical protein ABPG75_006508 [Micractinium tetrahymenae]